MEVDLQNIIPYLVWNFSHPLDYFFNAIKMKKNSFILPYSALGAFN